MVMATVIPYIGKDLHLSKTAMGAVMSTFFIGYTAFQIHAGVLVDKYGARKTMTVAVTMWTAPVTQRFAAEIGADAYAVDAAVAVEKANSFISA
jgi:methanogenic corrinoid protein MtbC1